MSPHDERLLYAAAQVLVAGLAWTYAAWRSEHRVVGLLLTWQLAANVARLAIDPVLDATAPPYEGALWAIYYLDHGLVLSFRFALLTAFWVHFAGGRPRTIGAPFALTIFAMIVYKETTGSSLEPAHAVVMALVSSVCVVIALRAMLAPVERLRVPDGAHAALLLVATADLLNDVLHHAQPLVESWPSIRATGTLVAGALVAGYATAVGRKVVLAWRGTSPL